MGDDDPKAAERPLPPPGPASASWLGEALLRSGEYAVIRVSLDGIIEEWLGAAPRLFGYAADEAIGQPFAMLFTPTDRAQQLDRAELDLARQVGRSEDDRWHLRKDGGRFWGNGVVNPLLDAQGLHVAYVKMLRDRTDLRIRYQGLQNRWRQSARQAATEHAALGTLLHELRNSLAPVVHAVRVIEVRADPAMQQRMLAVIHRQAEVLRRVLDDAGRKMVVAPDSLQVQRVVLQDALRASVDALAFAARAKPVELALVVPAAAVLLEVDPARMQQMLANLLSNAIKYTGPGGHVTVSASVEADMAVIRVDDDGEGIAPENIERVFELFTREEGHEAVPGQGIGLAVVKRLAWLHGGFVEARSPGKGAGSQFCLQLPLVFRGARATAPQDAADARTNENAGGSASA